MQRKRRLIFLAIVIIVVFLFFNFSKQTSSKKILRLREKAGQETVDSVLSFDRIFHMNSRCDPCNWNRLRKTALLFKTSFELIEILPDQAPEVQNEKDYLERLASVKQKEIEKAFHPLPFSTSSSQIAFNMALKEVILLAKERRYKSILVLLDDVEFFASSPSSTFEFFSDWKVLLLDLKGQAGAVQELQEGRYSPAFALNESVYDLLLFELSSRVFNFFTVILPKISRFHPKQVWELSHPFLVSSDAFPPSSPTFPPPCPLPKSCKKDLSNIERLKPYWDDLPEVCVIMTAYNAEKYLPPVIQAVMNQTYEKIKLVFVDDNSDDNTASIMNEFARSDPRIIYHRNPQNLKTYPSRNVALRLCPGEIITFQDADEIALPSRIEKQVHLSFVFHTLRSRSNKIVSERSNITPIKQLGSSNPSLPGGVHSGAIYQNPCTPLILFPSSALFSGRSGKVASPP